LTARPAGCWGGKANRGSQAQRKTKSKERGGQWSSAFPESLLSGEEKKKKNLPKGKKAWEEKQRNLKIVFLKVKSSSLSAKGVPGGFFQKRGRGGQQGGDRKSFHPVGLSTISAYGRGEKGSAVVRACSEKGDSLFVDQVKTGKKKKSIEQKFWGIPAWCELNKETLSSLKVGARSGSWRKLT